MPKGAGEAITVPSSQIGDHDDVFRQSKSRRAAAPAAVGAAHALGGLIPYKNSKALIAYYLGIFSFIPLLGILLGVPAFFLGVYGLKDAGKNPQIKGKAHAWVGIIGGGVFGFGQLLIVLIVAAAWFFAPSHSRF